MSAWANQKIFVVLTRYRKDCHLCKQDSIRMTHSSTPKHQTSKAWILQTPDTRRQFSRATWVPLRAIQKTQTGKSSAIGHTYELFACGSVAFPNKHREIANQLGWSDIGIRHSAKPFVYSEDDYSPIDEFRHNDKEAIGINLVFEHPQPVIGGIRWILNPDLVVALRLVKEGSNWVRPEEDFVVVAREKIDIKSGCHSLIEIKREFLMDYLAARGLSLRLSYYRQRIENVGDLENSPYADLSDYAEDRDGGRFELRVRKLESIFGRSWTSMRVWRTDIDSEEDAPVLGPHTNSNTEFESNEGDVRSYPGIRVEGEFWRNEWIENNNLSTRVRGDVDPNLPSFIIDTDGSRMPSDNLMDENNRRWLWFRPSVINELLSHRGFLLDWYTKETGAINSTSGYSTHFGINISDLITVYAYDIARLPAWEQRIWAAHNVSPEGKVSRELLASQINASPAETHAPEKLLLRALHLLGSTFCTKYSLPLFKHEVSDTEFLQQISRFLSTDQDSLLRLAKELVRVFSDRLDTNSLRKLSNHPNKDKLGSNKLLQSILAQKTGEECARKVFSIIVGTYDMRLGDAHPTSSKINEAFNLACIDTQASYLRQGEQLISNFGYAIWRITTLLFDKD